MDEQLSREKQVPGEVVEIYRQPERREVVEIYSRPLPACLVPPVAPRQPDRKKRKKGLWVFLALFLVLALLAVVGAVREELGLRDALTLWAAAGLLGLLLVPELEMAALFAGLFGWYSAARPAL